MENESSQIIYLKTTSHCWWKGLEQEKRFNEWSNIINSIRLVRNGDLAIKIYCSPYIFPNEREKDQEALNSPPIYFRSTKISAPFNGKARCWFCRSHSRQKEE
jgi:hypothetical protein